MKTKKSDRTNRNLYPVMRKVLAAVLAAFVLAGFTAGFGKGQVNAQDTEELSVQEFTAEKYYKSIEIQPGDSLWSIAEENRDAHYASVKDYIKEIKQINGLSSDQIHSGQYLTIAYYK